MINELLVKLAEAVEIGDLATIKSILNENPSLNRNPELPGSKWTCMYVAAEYGRVDILKALMEGQLPATCTAMVNVKGPENLTPLHAAAYANQLRTVIYLLQQQGIEINIYSSDNKWSPLGLAIYSRYFDVAKQLIGAGAYISSCFAWDKLYEKKGLEGLRQCVPSTDSNYYLALIIGHAVLQHINNSFVNEIKLKESELFTRDFLTKQLLQLQNKEIEPDDIADTIQSAMAIWKVEGAVHDTQWAALKEFMDTEPFATTYRTAQPAPQSVQALCVLSDGAKEALNYMPENMSAYISAESMRKEFT